MVLLTSSSISVAISSGVVCLFTFLLFLSGYVVQQQTVRSIQAALHPPPMPTSTLPVYFQDVDVSDYGVTVKTSEASDEGERQVDAERPAEGEPQGSRTSVKSDSNSTATNHTHTREEQPNQITFTQNERESEPAAVLAYVQLLSKPAHICSALLFFKYQKNTGDQNIHHLILYPSTWEENTSSDPVNSAVRLMRSGKDEHNITLEPVKTEHTSSVEPDIEQHLLTHLTTSDWNYDRIMYLRSPGVALDIGALDSSLRDSRTKTSLSRQWTLVDRDSIVTHPSVFLVSKDGIHLPRGRHRDLTAEILTTSHTDQDDGAMLRKAAYVHFEDGESEYPRVSEKEPYRPVFEKYEQGRAEVCGEFGFESERNELRKTRRRGLR